jgi:steroid 5-alpha reductase family enzyme
VIPCLPVYQPWLAGKVVKLVKDMRILGYSLYSIIFLTDCFTFEAGGDLQLSFFKSKPKNKGKLLTTVFWKYTPIFELFW